MKKLRNFYPGLIMLILAALLLAACGDSSTSAPASSGSASINISGANEVTMDAPLSNFVKTAFSGSISKDAGAIPDLAFKIYASDSEVAKLAADTDTAVTAAGYKYTNPADPSVTKMSATGDSATGFYVKANAPDLVPTISNAASFAKAPSNLPTGVDAASYQKFADQFKGKKSALILLSGTGIFDAVKKSRAGSDTTVATTVAATTTTAAATTTVAATTTSASTTSSKPLALPDIDNADEIKLSQTIESSIVTGFQSSATGVNDLSFKVYGSDDEAQALADSTDTALTGAGYKFTVPGATKPFQQGDALVGFYGKTNAPDLFVIIGDPNKGLGVAGLDAKNLAVIAPELKDKSGVLIVIAGTGLTKAFTNASAGGSSSATTAAATTAAATTAGSANSSLGQELVGKVFKVPGITETVYKVETLSEIKGLAGEAPLKPKGVWLIVYTDVQNDNDNVTSSYFDIIDATGNIYSSSSTPLIALTADEKYNSQLTPGGIPAHGKGKGFQVFDVPLDVTGLKPNI